MNHFKNYQKYLLLRFKILFFFIFFLLFFSRIAINKNTQIFQFHHFEQTLKILFTFSTILVDLWLNQIDANFTQSLNVITK